MATRRTSRTALMAVGAGSALGVNGGRGSSSEATRRLRQPAIAAGGAVPRSPPLCSVNGGRPVSWRARAGEEHGARASGAGRRGAALASAARRCGCARVAACGPMATAWREAGGRGAARLDAACVRAHGSGRHGVAHACGQRGCAG